MDAFVTYQKDTVRSNDLGQTLPKIRDLNTDINSQKPASIVAAQESTKTEAPEKKVYTNAQIRNWRIQQENKLQINSSRYIAPRTDINFSTTENLHPNIILPIRERKAVNTDWLTALIFLGIILFATVRYAYAKYVEHLFLSLFNHATSVRMLQEKSYPIFHGAFRLEAIFYITFPIFIFQALNLLKWENKHVHPVYFLLVFGFVLLYFFSKKFLYWISGSMFEATSETREYLFNIDNFNRSLGIILLPIIILISFTPAQSPVFIAYAGIIIVSIFNLLLLQRGIFILLKKQFSIIYLFLYLCTLEFLPLLLIYKVVVE